ncbi:hypothetical protein EGW08_001857 [Elysia chlorotica]|uniref:Uncharacterized protein n=1 Tax=Elysia chlorotica TaxID=188477 RepID=A0A433U977_ELYCH|nr:hypothetical protein EGW08_001857 [Elysia chlorotica]
MQRNAPNGYVPIEVISGYREGDNGEMEMEYERVFVQRPPDGVFNEPLDQGPELSSASSVSRPSARQLYAEKERLATFQGRWSPDYPVKPRDLARDGLYYIGPGDKVKCVFCQKVLRGWDPGDVVEQEHRRIYPNCPWVLGRCQEMNVPLNSTDTMQRSYGVSLRQEEGQHPMQELGSRLKTFDGKWPPSVPVDPRLIAEAGLFYIGDKDKTKCFQCNNIIQRWEAGDDPWREHAKLYPNCPYVLGVKGREFVEAVANSAQAVVEAPTQVSAGASQTQQSQGAEAASITEQMARMHIDDDMNSPAVLAFMDIFGEVPVSRIRQLLERIRLEKGPSYKLSSADLEPLIN